MTQVALHQALGSTANAAQDSGPMPTGVIEAFAGTTAPAGWSLCEGALVDRTTFARLFAVIGTAYGSGNGSTTFALPDFRGQFLRGHANTSANDPDRALRTASGTGGATGDAVGSAQAGGNASHSHSAFSSLPGGGSQGYATVYRLDPGGQSGGSTTALDTAMNPAGGNETRPKNINVKYIIKN